MRQPNHFHQCEGSPLTVSPHKERLGEDGCTPWCDRLLDDGPDGTGTEVQNTLWQCLWETPKSDVSITVEAEDFKQELRILREQASSSPSGVNYGHYKCLSAPWLEEEDQQRASEILNMVIWLVNQALLTGFAYHRWLSVTLCLLRKGPINLLEAKI